MFYLGWVVREKYAQHKMNKFLKTVEKTTIKSEVENTILINLVKESGVIYAYNNEDNTFLTQGKDVEEVVTNLTKYFPTKSFVANPNNLKEMDNYNESI
jgi:hypothetical protein